MLLDLHPSDQQLWARPKPNEGARLPATTEEGFAAAWNENRLFSGSAAGANARLQALTDYVDEVRKNTGTDLTDAASHITINSDWSAMSQAVAKLNAERPDLKLAAPTPEEMDKRAAVLSRQARQTYQQQQAGEGGGFGRFLGGLASVVTDPINLASAPLGGGEAGVLMTAAKFGGLAAASQVANEVVQEGFRERVQPGYGASGEPGANILEAGASGALLGAGGKVTGMALGRLWGRMKTGTWPTTVRDAGNLLESEANTQASNVYPGAAGEAAHRDALGSAIDSIVKGEPVDVAAHITPSVAASADERLAPLMAARAAAQRAEAEALAARPSEGTAAPELPFEQTAAAAQAERATTTLADQVAAEAKRAGYDMPPAEAAELAARMVKAPDDQVAGTLDQLVTAPSRAAEPPPARAPAAAPAEPTATAYPQAAVDRMLTSPEHADALRGDLDRARATSDVKIPAGVDAEGEPIFRSLDSALDEVDAFKKAADEIQACAAPVQQEAAE